MNKQKSSALAQGDMTPFVLVGTQKFMGKEIPVITGGFGKDKKVMTVKHIAEIHGVEVKHVNELINNNIKRFAENIDIIDLLSDEKFKVVIDDLGLKGSNRTKNIYILSERGYSKLIKIMDTDLAWEIHDKLIDDYFTLREVIKNNYPRLSKKQELALKIYDGGSNAIMAHKELVKIEVAEETARLKDGTNKILSAQQVVEMLGIRKLTTTILHEWFSKNGFV